MIPVEFLKSKTNHGLKKGGICNKGSNLVKCLYQECKRRINSREEREVPQVLQDMLYAAPG